MGDFSMTQYYNQYMDALHDLERAKRRAEARKDRAFFLLSVENEEDYEQWKADVAAAEAELKAAQDRVKRLEYLNTYGVEPPDPEEEKTKPRGLYPVAHFPDPPKPPKHLRP